MNTPLIDRILGAAGLGLLIAANLIFFGGVFFFSVVRLFA